MSSERGPELSSERGPELSSKRGPGLSSLSVEDEGGSLIACRGGAALVSDASSDAYMLSTSAI